jgi:hypothetical protein
MNFKVSSVSVKSVFGDLMGIVRKININQASHDMNIKGGLLGGWGPV